MQCHMLQIFHKILTVITTNWVNPPRKVLLGSKFIEVEFFLPCGVMIGDIFESLSLGDYG